MQLLQQSEATAAQRRIFLHAVDATDGITAETGLTGTGFISKNGAADAATTASLVEIGATNMPGRYYIELTATELNTLGIIEFRYKAAACAEVVARAQVVPYDPYSATNMGLTNLDAVLTDRTLAAAAYFDPAADTVATVTTLTGHTAQTGDSFARIGVAGAGLTNIDLPNQTMDIIGSITGSLSGSVGSVVGHTPQTGDNFARIGAPAGASVSADILAIDNFVDGLESTIGVAGAGLTDLGGMSTAMKAEVNVEAKDVLFTDTDAEPGQVAPPATASLSAKIGYLYKAWRNRSNQTATTYQLFNDAATVVDQKATVSDDATTAEKGEIVTGP